MSTETRQPTSSPIVCAVLGYVLFGSISDARKALVEKVKLLNKVKEEKEKNQSLTTKQLAALVCVS